MSEKDPYKVLGLTPDAEDEIIDTVYKKLVKKHHPDQGGDAEKLKEIKNAYENIQTQRDENPDNGTGQAGGDNNGIFDIFDTPIETEDVTGNLSQELTLEGDQLTIGLTNISESDISDYVWEQSSYIPDDIDLENCLTVSLHVRNTSDYVQRFKPNEVRAIGDNGRRYDAQFAGMGLVESNDDVKPLPKHLYVEDRDMEPHTKANFLTAIEDMPESVNIDKVVYPFKLFDGHQIDGVVKGKTRYVFEIEPNHWKEFQLVAGGELKSLSNGGDESESEMASNNEGGDGTEPKSRSQTQETQNDVFSERDMKRLSDLLELQPTTNSELQERWGMESGKEVYQYLKNTLSEYYERNSDSKIVAIPLAERLIEN